MYRKIIKPLFDFLLALFAVLFFLPWGLVIALIIKIDSKGPVFFFQERLGKKGKVFKVFKFRTMTDEKRVSNREIYKGDSEVTFIGAFLRRFKVDELPQLINVLKGDMSFVGPRPALVNQLGQYDDFSVRRLEVLPGLTGLSQVNGNIYLSWEERWKMDVQYVDNISLITDIKLILKTFAVVVLGEEKFKS